MLEDEDMIPISSLLYRFVLYLLPCQLLYLGLPFKRGASITGF